jgi:hypothetical protein
MAAPEDRYPLEEFPWNFYFNGVLMPQWGACWGFAGIELSPEKDWDADVGHRDVELIKDLLHHAGAIESAEPDVFIYAVQEVLCELLERRDFFLKELRSATTVARAEEIYGNLASAAVQMRRLAKEQRIAFWTSGYEADRLRLLEAMEAARLPESDPRHQPAPHVRQFAACLRLKLERQQRRLHKLAQSGRFEKTLRSELHGM